MFNIQMFYYLFQVEEKYSTPPAKVKNTYKRSKKG